MESPGAFEESLIKGEERDESQELKDLQQLEQERPGLL
jgi:hypothetical protein